MVGGTISVAPTTFLGAAFAFVSMIRHAVGEAPFLGIVEEAKNVDAY